MEVFLYKCEVCGTARFNEQDNGRTWYASCVGCCGIWTYHDKIIIDLRWSKSRTLECPFLKKEESLCYDSQEESTASTDDNRSVDQ